MDRCVIVIGQMDNTVDNTFESANRIYSAYGLCPTIPTGAGAVTFRRSSQEIMKRTKDISIVAMRGRNTVEDVKWTQQLELRTDGLCNAITTVSKDFLLLEIYYEKQSA